MVMVLSKCSQPRMGWEVHNRWWSAAQPPDYYRTLSKVPQGRDYQPLIKNHEIISPLQGFVWDKFRSGGCVSLHRRLCTSRPMRGYEKYSLTNSCPFCLSCVTSVD
ncbi:MAG: hypothetical protein LBK82_04095 [Planctomycetaceae bacterium]|nr:hypothetical protein [Planctomycetaceae bacterium]